MKTTVGSLVYAAWPTAWGPMGAVASAKGLCRVMLPHYSMEDLKAMLAFEHPEAREDLAHFAELSELTRAYFNGSTVSFDSVACDMPAETSFSGRVLRACRQIPSGQTLTYTQLAMKIGQEQAARAVASAMAKNRTPLVIPCHRVVGADGRLHGFSAPGGIPLKQRMLDMEKTAR